MSAILHFHQSPMHPFPKKFNIHDALVDAKTPEKLKDIIDSHLQNFNAMNLSTAIHRLAKFHKQYTEEQLYNKDTESLKQLKIIDEIFKNPDYFQKIIHAVLNCMQKFEPKNLATLAWSFATLGIKHTLCMVAITGKTLQFKCEGFEPQHLSKLAWSLATLRIRRKDLLEVIAKRSVQLNCDGFSPQSLANLAWSFATFGIEHKLLMEIIAEKTVQLKCEGFTPENLANLAWSFATLNIEHKLLMETIAKKAMQIKWENCDPQNLTLLAWSFCVQGCQMPELFQFIANALTKIELRTEANIRQALTFHLYCDIHNIRLNWDTKLCIELKQYSEKLKKNKSPFSKTHLNVYNTLEHLSWGNTKVKIHQEYSEICYFIDIALFHRSENQEYKYAIDIMGSTHYSSEGRLLGDAKLKKNLLERLGWKTIEIPVELWYSFDASPDPSSAFQFLQKQIPHVFTGNGQSRTLPGIDDQKVHEDREAHEDREMYPEISAPLILFKGPGVSSSAPVMSTSVSNGTIRKSTLNPHAPPFEYR